MNSIKDTLKKTKPGAGDNGRWKYLALCTAEEDEKELLNSDIGCSPVSFIKCLCFIQYQLSYLMKIISINNKNLKQATALL